MPLIYIYIYLYLYIYIYILVNLLNFMFAFPLVKTNPIIYIAIEASNIGTFTHGYQWIMMIADTWMCLNMSWISYYGEQWGT